MKIIKVLIYTFLVVIIGTTILSANSFAQKQQKQITEDAQIAEASQSSEISGTSPKKEQIDCNLYCSRPMSDAKTCEKSQDSIGCVNYNRCVERCQNNLDKSKSMF